MAPKPPYATDIPDEDYDKPAPTRRLRLPKPQDPNARSSAYDVYENYLAPGENNNASARNSGIGALGLGLLNGDMSDSEDEDDDKPAPANKQAALLAATTAAAAGTRPIPTQPTRSQPTDAASHTQSKSPPPIAAPRPGYAAPIAALNLARPAPTASPQGRQPPSPPSNPFEPPENPFEPPQASPVSPGFSSPNPRRPPPGIQIPNLRVPPAPASPRVPSTPHPLQPPMTPITPVFVRPTASSPPTRDVKFSEPIIRSNTEETLLPKRGERGDDFWRRFSIIAKVENGKNTSEKQSSWLRKTQSGTQRLSIWVYVVGVLLLLCVAGGIGLGWYASHKSTSHTPPTAIGGSANQSAVSGPGTSTVGSKDGGPSVKTSLHVSPTRTIDNRDVAEFPRETGPPVIRRHVKRFGRNGSVMF